MKYIVLTTVGAKSIFSGETNVTRRTNYEFLKFILCALRLYFTRCVVKEILFACLSYKVLWGTIWMCYIQCCMISTLGEACLCWSLWSFFRRETVKQFHGNVFNSNQSSIFWIFMRGKSYFYWITFIRSLEEFIFHRYLFVLLINNFGVHKTLFLYT